MAYGKAFEMLEYIIIGMSALGELLFVSHAETDDRIRIISARRLTRKERKQYEQ